MQRISLAWFSLLGTNLSPLTDFTRVSELAIFHLQGARQYLVPLSDENVYPLDLRASRPVIRELLSLINAVLAEPDQAAQQTKLDQSKWNIVGTAGRLEPLLGGELAVQPIYHVWPKRAFNIEVLVAAGENLFSTTVRNQLTADERYNIGEAGKCLAFEIPTAAAFHIFRCSESILRRYYEIVVGELPKPKMRNWGAYIRNIRKCNGDEKVLTILAQIKDMHRNPVIHPETQLDNESAMYLAHVVFGLTLTDIGRAFGRDRTTAAYACELVENRRDDPVLNAALETLEHACGLLGRGVSTQLQDQIPETRTLECQITETQVLA